MDENMVTKLQEKIFLDLCEGYREVSNDQVEIKTLWSLVTTQSRILFRFEGESSYQFYMSQLSSSSNENIWSIFLSAGILFEHYLINEEWRGKLLRDYSRFLCQDFSLRPFSLELIRVHFFLTKQLLGKAFMTTTVEQLATFFSPLVDHLMNSEYSQTNLIHWFSCILGEGLVNPHIATLCTNSHEFNILTCFTMKIKAAPKNMKSDLTKLLIMPYIKLLGVSGANFEQIVQEIWMNLCLEFQKSGDLDVASIITCSVVELLIDAVNIRMTLQGIWTVLFDLFNDTLVVHRKRGAHIMQLYTCYLGRSNQITNLSWCPSFLEVYRQLEGCSTMHLVSQIWSELNSLILFSNSNEGLVGSQDLVPSLSFSWVTILFRCLLQTHQISIRKLFIHKILGGKLQIPINKETISWICNEFLQSHDTSIYFTTNWVEYPHEIAWLSSHQNSIDTSPEIQITDHQFDLNIDDTPGCTQSFTLSHPGILFPLFLSNWLLSLIYRCRQQTPAHLYDCPEYELLNHLIKSFLSTICGTPINDLTNGSNSRNYTKFTSLCAIKWLFRAFSYPVIQNSLYFNGISLCSIGSFGVRTVLTFVKEKFSSMSQILRSQIYQGMLPMLLSLSYHDDSNSSATISFFEIFQEFGLRTILESHHNWNNLTRAITNSLSNRLGEFHDVTQLLKQPQDYQYLPVIIGLISGSNNERNRNRSEMNLVIQLFQQQFDIVKMVFATPYMPITQQWSAIYLVKSTSSFLCSLMSVEEIQGAADFSHVIYEESYQGNFQLLLNGLLESSLEFSSYLSFLLLTTIHSSMKRENSISTHSHMQIKLDSLSKYQNILQVFLELLLIAFVNPMISISQFQSIKQIHLDTLLQIIHLFNKYQGNNIPESPCLEYFLLFTLSQLCHNFRCLSKIYRKNKNVKILEKLQSFVDDIPLLLTVFQTLMSFEIVSSSVFQAGFKSSFQQQHQQQHQEQQDSISTSLYHQYPSYGKYSDDMIGYRWLCLSSIMDLVIDIRNIFPQNQQTEKLFDPFLLQLLQNGIENIDLCSHNSISEIFHTFILSLRYIHCNSPSLLLPSSHLSPPSSIYNSSSQLLVDLLQATWNCCFETDDICYNNVKLFIQFCFSIEVMSLLDVTISQEYFLKIMKYSSETKPFILQFLIYHLTTLSLQSANYSLLFPFLPYFQDLLIYREPTHDEHCQSDEYHNIDEKDGEYINTIYGILDYSRVHNIDRLTSNISVRIMLLLYLQHLQNCYLQQTLSHLQDLFQSLLNMNSQKCYKVSATVGSQKFGEKLRCWQSLCVLIHSVDYQFCQKISHQVMNCLGDPMAHGIRVHVEICYAKLLEKFPELMLPPLLQILKRFNHSQQTVASYFVVLGHLVKKSFSLLLPWRKELVEACIPWFTGASGLSRAIAQYVVHAILSSPLSHEVANDDDDDDAPANEDSRLLIDIARFLKENKEVIKLRTKQIAFFDSYDLDSKCSVQGILSIPMDNWGEHIPEHILDLLSQAIKGNLLYNENENDHYSNVTTVGDLATGTSQHSSSSSSSSLSFNTLQNEQSNNFQTKLIPYDELQLVINSTLSTSRQRNERNKQRQEIIICASLIDKITNLAGIARTCEIFAIKELIISDLKVLKSEDFQTMSVASSNWLPIREIYVPDSITTRLLSSPGGGSSSVSVSDIGVGVGVSSVYSKLISYLHEMKRDGYQIIGLEQTGGSVSLEAAEINSKCVILLGREKEGIPVELLNEMDLCLEIPQYGVTRSLNVHVSASLVVWEITKRNIQLGRL